MKPTSARPYIIYSLLVLLLAQMACSLGAATASAPTGPAAAPTVAANSSQHGTVDQAMAMLQAAVQHYNSAGRKQALADFTNRASPFFEGDLYVACIDKQLVQSANGGFPELVGSSVQPLSRAAWDAASTTEVKSVSYTYTDPATGQPAPKTFYYEKVGTDVCGVGVYH